LYIFYHFQLKKMLILYICIIFLFSINITYGEFDIPSTWCIVGSGARAIGTNAFLASADDATAASWNPGGLVQVELNEYSVVIDITDITENLSFGKHPEADGKNGISDTSINYFGFISSFEKYGYNMSFALTYQKLYSFNRSWTFNYIEDFPTIKRNEVWNYKQTGALSALGLSYCIEVLKPKLALGFTLNFWDNGLSPNQWKQTYDWEGEISIFGNDEIFHKHHKVEEYTFDGFNLNLGLLWAVNYKLSIGAVLKTPFTADIFYTKNSWHTNQNSTSQALNERLKMPISYGVGFLYRFSDQLYIAADFYRIQWDDFIYIHKNGTETCPINNKAVSESDIDPTHQIRIGAEYLFLNKHNDSGIPIRAGIFYDPSPAEKNPDDYYGFSIGTGFIKNSIGSIDIAYQYRFGNNVATSGLDHLGFSQDIREHKVYLSMICYQN